jgi:hypothetical protein
MGSSSRLFEQDAEGSSEREFMPVATSLLPVPHLQGKGHDVSFGCSKARPRYQCCIKTT